MFLIRRPSSQVVERFATESLSLPLSYHPVGIAGSPPEGYDLDEAIVALGHGEAAFEHAKAAGNRGNISRSTGWRSFLERRPSRRRLLSPCSFTIWGSGRSTAAACYIDWRIACKGRSLDSHTVLSPAMPSVAKRCSRCRCARTQVKSSTEFARRRVRVRSWRD
jgi:hypothetical protein